MSIWHMNDPRNLSVIAMADVLATKERYPARLVCHNDSVARAMHLAPGIVEIVSRHGDDNVLTLTGGIHGDEKAGVFILDRLIKNIRNGSIPVKRNMLLMYGNLMAMAANDGRGARCIEPEAGVTANLNRCFGREEFTSPSCYAEIRANQMIQAARVLRGCHVEAIDIHQSFAVPTLNDVRPKGDRTEYTYAMVYPNSVNETLTWIYKYYSDIVAGAILNDMSVRHYTWAGYMASEHKAKAATFEQGTIGHVDHVTFTPQLYENLARSIAGNGELAEPEGFDVWRCVRAVIRNSDAFTFLNEQGEPINKAPLDFVPLAQTIIARDGTIMYNINPGERLLFAHADVPIGDRAAQIITRFETDVIPCP